MNRRKIALAALLLPALVSCEDANTETKRTKRSRPLVFTTIHPLQYFVRKLAGEFVDCEVAIPAGRDPRHWIPDRSALSRLATADLVIFHGASLDDWQSKVGLPRSRQSIVCTGMDEHFLAIKGAITHTHGGKSHTHDGIDPFVWLDLELAEREAGVVARAMKRLLPDHGGAIDRNLRVLAEDLRGERTAHASIDLSEVGICATDRLYDYWARQQKIEILNLDLSESVSEENSAERDRARRLLGKNRAGSRGRLVLCPSDPAPQTARMLSDLGLTPVVFDPCFTAPAGEDFLTVMRANRGRLQSALDSLRK